MNKSILNALQSLSFSEIEARAYGALLEGGPQTGYGVSKRIQKPVANTYKALETLERKGAVLPTDGETRLLRAVRPSELLKRLSEDFAGRATRAEAALAALDREQADDHVYRVSTADQAIGKARGLLRNATRVALVDVFPAAAALLARDIAAAKRRGVTVIVKAYAPTALNATWLVIPPSAQEIRERWPAEWLNLVVDGSSFLMALFDSTLEHLHQAVWSESPYLSWIYHTALLNEFTYGRLESMALQDPQACLKEALASMERIRVFDAPGYDQLLSALSRFESEE